MPQRFPLPIRIYQALLPKAIRPRTIAEKKLIKASCGRILAGPFKGMRYFPPGVGDAVEQRLIGTFEIELRDAIEAMAARDFTRVVNVGAAEGYYAVGMAIRLPRAKVIAFEMLTGKRELIRELAVMNDVGDRVEARGICDAAALRDAIGPEPSRCLIVIDVEGAEWELLDPAAVPQVLQTSMIVELHEFARPGLAAELERRFAATHRIDKFPARRRTAADLPIRPPLLTPWMLSLTNEMRPYVQSWWALTTKA